MLQMSAKNKSAKQSKANGKAIKKEKIFVPRVKLSPPPSPTRETPNLPDNDDGDAILID